MIVMDKYRKNFILCDNVVYYCLLCDELLGTIPDVEKHIRWDNHRKSLKTQTHFPKFRKEFIYKVENYFYCEVCNFAVSDIAAVTKHINNEEHKAKKNNPKTDTKEVLGQYDSGYIIINQIKLNMAQWNSIVEKQCLICNVEVKNNNLHMGLKDHIINLINSEIKCDDNDHYFRMINNDKFHCFTCNKVLSSENLKNHWLNCKHNDETEIKKAKEVEFSKSNGNATEDIVKMEEIHKKLIGSLQDFFFIDAKDQTAICKECMSVVAINFTSMIEHMKVHQNIQVQKTNPQKATNAKPDTTESSEEEVVYCEVIDHGKRRSELAKFGKENSIKLNFNGSKGWCLLCDRYLSAHKNIFKDHIKGATHRGNLELQGLISPKKHDTRDIKTKSILQCRLEYLLEEQEFYVFDYLSIDVFSFFLVYQIEDPHFKKTKCYACNELFPQGQEGEHCRTPKHKNKFLAAKFVMSFEEEGEFIREIRKNYFHCGFCNKTFPFLEQLLVHKDSIQHKMLQYSKTGLCFGTIKFNTKSDDVYMKLLHCGFGKLDAI